MKWVVLVVVGLVCAVARGADPRGADPEERPERIDVVYGNLVEQQQALEAVAEIVSRLEVVAEYPEAARALLSDQGEPTERLRRALDGVATRGCTRLEESLRLANAKLAEMEGRAEVRTPEPVDGGSAEVPTEESWLDPADVSVVYAEEAAGGGRVVLSVVGTRYAVAEGASVWVGDVLVEVVKVEGGDGGIVVEMRMNRVPFSRRVRG